MSGPTAETFAEFYRKLVDLFERLKIPDFAFTGGLAYSVWVQPRATRDADLCAVLPLESVDKLLAWQDGFASGPERLPTMVRFPLGSWDVDLFTVNDPYYRKCMERCLTGTFGGVAIRIVSVEDLLIHKMIKLRSDKRDVAQDASDIRKLVEVHRATIDFQYIKEWAQPAEAGLVGKADSMKQSELVAALETL